MVQKKLNIYQYPDYKLFLKDYYQFQKKQNRKFSYRYFAAKAGTAPSLLKDIIEGRRNLTEAIMVKYAGAMDLGKKETEYFRTLVKFVNSKTYKDKNIYFGQIMGARRNLVVKFLDEAQYEFYSTWYHSAIRELISMQAFREDPEWIAKKLNPKITAAKAKKSIALLETLNLVTRDHNNKLSLSDPVITTESEVQSMIIRNYNSETIRLASEAMERFPKEDREISSLTLGVSLENYERIKTRVRAFKEEILDLVLEDRTPSERACLLNFQLFPLNDNMAEEDKS